MNDLAPIVLFVYNRPIHTRKVIEALKANTLAKESILFINIDFPKNKSDEVLVSEVREYIKNISGFKNICIWEAEQNKGVDNSVIHTVSKIIQEYGKVIVLEDDHVTSPTFLEYMNAALIKYEKNPKIAGISGYSPEVKFPSNYKENYFLSVRGSSWGWATWSEEWLSIDWDVKKYSEFKKNKVMQAAFSRGGTDMLDMLSQAMERESIPYWDIRRCFDMSLKDKFFLYPCKSFVLNIGNDGSGLHCGITSKYDVNLEGEGFLNDLAENIVIDERITKLLYRFYSGSIIKEKLRATLKFLHVLDYIRRVKSWIK